MKNIELICQEVHRQHTRRLNRLKREGVQRVCLLPEKKQDCIRKMKNFAKNAPLWGLLPVSQNFFV